MKRKTIFSLLFLLLFSGAALAEEITIHVRGMVCGFCAQGIKKKLASERAVRAVAVSLEEGWVKVTTKKDETLPDAKIRTILKDAGYDIDRIERKS
jgi:mercuric ion binding protein